MKSLKSYFVFLLLSISLSAVAQKAITLEELWTTRTFAPEYVWGLNPLNDGNQYSKIDYNPEKGELFVAAYKYEDGKLSDTIFNSAWAEIDGQPLMFDSYSFSSDESKILLAVNTEHIYRYSTRADYYIFDRSTRKATPVSIDGKQMYPTFSPDGSKIAYVFENNLYFLDLKSGEHVQLTGDGRKNEIINGASDWVYEEELEMTRAFEWSPDGRRIAFLRFDESQVREYSMTMYGSLYPTSYSFKYPKAGEKNSIVTLWLYNLGNKNKQEVLLDEGEEYYLPRIKWTKDPHKLSVQRMNRHQNRLDLILVDANTAKYQIIFSEDNEFYVEVTDNLTFMDDGEHFIWSSEQDGYNHLYLFNMDGTMEKQLTMGEWDVTEFYGVDEEAGIVYYQSSEESPLERYIYSVKLNGKGKQKLNGNKGWNTINFSSDFSYSIREFSNQSTPSIYSVYNNRNREVRIIKDNKRLAESAKSYGFTEKEFFTFQISEHTVLYGWMMKPADFDPNKKYPVLMYVYGGPGSQTVQNVWGGRNDIWYQMLTQKGYIVVSVDGRGTGARGEQFKKSTYLNLGKLEANDQIEAAQYLSSLEYVDGGRIGIWGWSFGAYLSSLCLFAAPDIFKMAMAVAPVTNWKFYDTIYTERFMRTPQENNEGYEGGSPINHVDGLKGKYLLVHGSADDNVHFQNSMELITALVTAGKDFDLMIYPDKNHGIGGAKTRLHLYKKMTQFVLDNL
jgi:dipeptidyl-peptidase 4